MSHHKEVFDQERFQKEVLKAKEIYFSWPEKIRCIALNEDIRITRTGWNHIVDKQRRTKNQSYFRARNFPQARKLIETINIVQDICCDEKESGKVMYWVLQGVIDRVVIQVIIRQIGNQPKQFFSLVYKGGVPRNKRA